MDILADGIVAFLAAVGVTALIWLLADLLVQRREPPLRWTLVLPLPDAGEEIDWSVYQACRLQRQLGAQSRVVLLDCGLEEINRRRAQVLAENNENVTVLFPSQLEEFIT